MTPRTAGVVVWVLVQFPAVVAAQTSIDGTAEWTVDRNATQSNGQSSSSNSFWQNYALRYASSIWDWRLARFSTEGLFRTNRLTSTRTEQPGGRGRQEDLGYRLGASLLPTSPFPFFVQASRVTSGSSGDLGAANPIRSGMIAPSGAPPLDFESRNKALQIGWQFNLGNMPRVELSYRRGSSVVTGGEYRAEQHDGDVSAAVFKDTVRSRQSFRYQQTSFENFLGQTFTQRLSTLDYDLNVSLTNHTRVIAHGGRRGTFSRSQYSAPVLEQDTGAYALPPTQVGLARTEYGLAGISYEPSARFALRFNGNLDRQTGDGAIATAQLATASTYLEVFRGLSISGGGTSGTRSQTLADTALHLTTQTGVVGATYQAGVRWLSGTATATRGLGSNTTEEGQKGTSQSWSREVSLSSTIAWLGLGAGYERVRNRDRILDYGNYDSEHTRASVQTQARRGSLTTSVDRLRVTRGQALTFVHSVQRTFSGTAVLRMWRENLATATAGGFINDYTNITGPGRDRTLFWGVGGQMVVHTNLRGSATIRDETASATKTGFNQRGLSLFGRLEYRLRTVRLAVEYRRNNGRMQYPELSSLDVFRGQQLRVSLSRQFGFLVR